MECSWNAPPVEWKMEAYNCQPLNSLVKHYPTKHQFSNVCHLSMHQWVVVPAGVSSRTKKP